MICKLTEMGNRGKPGTDGKFPGRAGAERAQLCDSHHQSHQNRRAALALRQPADPGILLDVDDPAAYERLVGSKQ